MADEKKLAKSYHDAIKRLEAAEQRQREALDRLDLAKKERRAADITKLKREAAEIERGLEDALQAATVAHRHYWECRRVAMIPLLNEAALLMRQFNRIAYAAGCLAHDPALSIMQNVPAPPVDVVDDVPAEGPDSELLGDTRGYWR